MNKKLVLGLLFILGLPIVAGKVRAYNAAAENYQSFVIPSYMGLSYEEAVEEGHIIKNFSWEEESTQFKIEIPNIK